MQGGGVLSDMGCHSIAVAWYILTPVGKPLTFMEPVSVTGWRCSRSQEKYRKQLLALGVDYAKVPAEDFATGTITFRNRDRAAGASQFAILDVRQAGLRLPWTGWTGLHPQVNTLRSPESSSATRPPRRSSMQRPRKDGLRGLQRAEMRPISTAMWPSWKTR